VDEKNKIQEFFAKLAFMKCLGIGHARIECAETAHATAVFNLKALECPLSSTDCWA